MNKSGKIKVLIIDDSAVIRQMLTAVLNEDPDIEVVGTAANPLIARDKIKSLKPDVLTLDVEMPGMDGLTFLEKLMRLHPLPVVMVSSLTKSGAAATLRALDLGAVDFVTKPQKAVRETMVQELMDEIRTKVRAAAMAHVHPAPVPAPVRSVIPGAPNLAAANKQSVIAIGASAGGTQAITDVLARLPVETPGIVIVQHMPPKFTTSFAERLNSLSALEVREAKDGERVTPGVALLAPGGYQMALWRDSAGYAVKVYEGEKVNLHRPSVDVLFDSVARCKVARSLGIILTGMGSDGAQGLCAMKTAGAHTIAQDQESCVVYGMPGEAVRLRGVSEILPLDQIAGRIVTWASGETARA